MLGKTKEHDLKILMLLRKTKLWESETFFLEHILPEFVSCQYVDWLNDPEINQFLEARFVSQSIDSVKKFVEGCNEADNICLWGIFDKKEGVPSHIGNVKIGPIDRVHFCAEVGFLIGEKNFWGKGVATKVLRVVADISRWELGLRKLTAGCYGKNVGSFKALTRAGFVCIGERKNHVVCGDGYDSVFLFDKELS